ncbi:hypothetical protein Q4E93_20680 [Flavitalea sp. BT771]|uniref:hypothetical protein n=1 Tax=Flavitalea sp. BT771 TaxID=3063329 RepID=UPI0026E1444B|nr:hypothetical protein [Flavitalea sp. BT771]MDO6433036.1 hypothetical protein [Flavitalea sp. BT771]MDV6221688.1 hypothetical protein [Flavitalea sp. BT771]
MKPSSFRKVAMATAWLIMLSAFTTGKQANRFAVVSGDNTHYYYYMASGDTYDAFNTVADEIARLQTLTGEYVDTNPFGGTILAKGYTNNVVPHNVWPSSYLYLHN